MRIFTIVGLAVLGVTLALTVRSFRPELALLIGVATGIAVLLSVVGELTGVIDALRAAARQYGVDEGYLGVLLKIIGIAYLAQFGVQICRDAGESAAAAKVELAGAAADGAGGEAAEIGVTAESGLGTGDPGAAAEEGDLSIEDGVNAWLGELDLAAWQAFLASLPQDVRALWADADLETLVGEWASGGMDGAPDALLRQLGGVLLGQARASAGLLLTLLGLAFLTALVQALTAGREAGVQDAAGFVCRCFSLSAVLAASLSPVTLVLSCMDTLAAFMELALPALTLLLTAVGGVASAGVFQPAMTALCGTVTGAMRGAVVPLAVAGGVMGLVGALSARVRMGETAGLLKRLAKWLTGAVSALYLGATAVRGMAAAAYDGVAIRTAKYAASSLVPMVGGMVSGTMDTMLGCALLVKNAAGLAAILLTLSVVLLPLMRLAVQMLLLRAAAALAEPLSGAQLPAMFSAAADMLSFLFAATLAVALMFLVTVALMTGLTGLAMVA